MRSAINRVLDQLDLVYTPETRVVNPAELSPILDTVHQVQDAYLEVIQQALSLLVENRVDDSRALLQAERDQLGTTLERIGTLVEQVAEAGEPRLRLLVEYLFTRARLVDELKMFPSFGLQLLERHSLDESVDETIDYLEQVMTGRQNLYSEVVSSLKT